ncbi:MAG TPA: (2Fe-2S)-binding protein, partial [Pseudonocardiaceae bacterium]|nr:(2Fe-2S)-binding protein [Pseudonocardiaceae bacterium]
NLGRISDVVHPYLGTVLAATGTWLDGHADIVSRFCAAWQTAVDMLLRPERAADVDPLLATVFGLPAAQIPAMRRILADAHEGLVPDGVVDEDALDSVYRLRAWYGPAKVSPIRLTVNGTDHDIACDPDTPLLYVLRNDLGLMAAKFGCGTGLCGACNVIVDGRAVHSCDTPVRSVVGRRVRTLEGLGEVGSPHPLQRAFVAEQAMQCGYCISGMIVSAAALLESTTDLDDASVRRALDDNLCRCGAHNRIVRAILAAAEVIS